MLTNRRHVKPAKGFRPTHRQETALVWVILLLFGLLGASIVAGVLVVLAEATRAERFYFVVALLGLSAAGWAIGRRR